MAASHSGDTHGRIHLEAGHRVVSDTVAARI